MALLPLCLASSSILGLNYALCGSRVVIQPFSTPYIFEYVQPENLSFHHRSCPFITGLVLLSQVLSSHTELDTSCLLLASTPKFILFISHTDSCSADQFVCADYSCIDALLRCDGKVDCRQHGGDEDDCCE